MTQAATPPRPTPRQDGATKSRKTSLPARAREAANDAGDRIADSVEDNPLAMLVAGIVVGLAAGSLLPKTKVEGRYLGSVGEALNEGALAAARAAGEAGKAELAAIGISKVGANEQLGKLLEGLGGALRNVSGAARDSARQTTAKRRAARKA